jgi:F-type H+-transporting ATPase subunit epsilon
MTLPESIELLVVSPQRQLLREKVASVQLPGASGELGILPGHAPLITELGNGELSYRSSGGAEPVVLAVLSGFAEVLSDRVTVLAETAERPEEIDVERAKAALARAEQRLSSGDADVDWDRATIALQRAIVRIKVGSVRHRVHSHRE